MRERESEREREREEFPGWENEKVFYRVKRNKGLNNQLFFNGGDKFRGGEKSLKNTGMMMMILNF